MSEMEKFATTIVDNKVKEIKDMINIIHADIVENIAKVSIPESVFVEYFLTFFKNSGHLDMDTPLTLKWLELSGGPYNEVDVIDVKGNLAYTVPSLYCRPATNEDVANTNFSEIVGGFNLRSNRLYSDGINFANDMLSGIGDNVMTEYDKHTLRWENIFKRYVENEITKTKKVTETVDFLDFD